MKKCLNCAIELNSRQHKYCSNKCQADYQYNKYIERWHNGLEKGVIGKFQLSSHIEKFIWNKYNSKCAECDWNKINPITNKSPLEIEHIDGNFENNKEENLLLLCPNCHSLTPTYKALNIGKGRKERKGLK